MDTQITDLLMHIICRSSNSTTTDLPLKVSENGSTGTPGPTLASVTETFSPKERLDVKSPQLPFGENVAVATGAQ